MYSYQQQQDSTGKGARTASPAGTSIGSRSTGWSTSDSVNTVDTARMGTTSGMQTGKVAPEKEPTQGTKGGADGAAQITPQIRIGAAIGSGTVTASALNVRSGPGTEHDRVGDALAHGSTVSIYGIQNGWYCIGQGRWVIASYVSTGKEQAGNTHGAPEKKVTGQTKPSGIPAGPDLKGIAKNVWDAMFGGTGLGTDEEKVYANLAKLNHNAAQIAAFKDLYRATYGTDVVADIGSEFSDGIFGNELTRALGYLKATAAPSGKGLSRGPAKSKAPAGTKRPGGAKNIKAEFYAKYYAEAVKNEAATGVPALVTLGQAALESGWGKHAPGNNFFGVKAKKGDAPEEKQLLKTREVLKRDDAQFPEVISVTRRDDGKYEYVVRDWFRKYPSAAAGFADHAKVLLGKRYQKAFLHKNDPYAFAQAIADAGYATDPNYASSLKNAMRDLESVGASAGSSAATGAANAAAHAPTAQQAAQSGAAGGTGGASTTGLNPALTTFITELRKDTTYGSMVVVNSEVRSAEEDARAVLKNQRKDSAYYKIFTPKWEAGILAAVKGLNLHVAADFETAVQRLTAWELAGNGGPHVTGRAVDFGLANGSAGFRSFLKGEAEKRGFTFIDETSKGHYHVQM